MPVGEVSKALGRGRHTTRHVELFALGGGTCVIDTPGFSSFDTEEMDLELKARLPETFPEFAPYVDQCRFTGCTHTKEKGCRVLQAVQDGDIPASRHRSYLRLYDELKDLKGVEKEALKSGVRCTPLFDAAGTEQGRDERVDGAAASSRHLCAGIGTGHPDRGCFPSGLPDVSGGISALSSRYQCPEK